MGQLLIDLSFRVFGTSYVACILGVFIAEYMHLVDEVGKIILLFLGIITGIMMYKAARLKKDQANIDLTISKMKLEEQTDEAKKSNILKHEKEQPRKSENEHD